MSRQNTTTHLDSWATSGSPSADGSTLDRKRALDAEKAISYFFMHKSWRERSIDHWTYVGDAQWTRRMSIDIQIPERYDNWIKDEQRSAWLIPILELPRGTTFSSFDLRGPSNRALKVKYGAISSLYVVSALVGAMEIGHEKDPSSPSIAQDGALRYFLYELLRMDFPMEDGLGMRLDPLDARYSEGVKDAALTMLHRLQMLGEDEKRQLRLDGLDFHGLGDRFASLYDTSALFRWFVLYYTERELYLAVVEDRDTIVKCSYQSSSDLFAREGLHHVGSPFCYFSAPLDALASSEGGCITIEAPEGMSFVPNFNPHRTGRRGTRRDELSEAYAVIGSHAMKARFDGSWLEVIDLSASSPDGRNTALVGVGSLSPTRASFKAARTLWRFGGSGGATPTHRIPTSGNQSPHRYVIELMLIPVLGTRFTRYFITLLMCLALFGIDVASIGQRSSLSIQAVTSLAPIITLLTASMDGAGYIRREALKVPTYVTYATASLSMLLMLLFAVTNSSGNSEAAASTAFAGLAVSILAPMSTVV